MSVYLWLSGQDCVAGIKGYGLDVHLSNSGCYIVTQDPCDPTRNPICEEVLQNVVRATCRCIITSGLRPDGVYRNGMAELVAKTEISFGDGQNVSIQELNICAPTIEDVDWIYSLFRKGQLEPEENWEPKDADDAAKTVQRDEVREFVAEARMLIAEFRTLIPGLRQHFPETTYPRSRRLSG